jgi:hypothetical protein
MKVLNIHERKLEAIPEQVGALIDSLASQADALWPRHSWPRMKFDRPLSVGAVGGHGPVRYWVEAYLPGQSITFRFSGPKGFKGVHRFEVLKGTDTSATLRHVIQMNTSGPALLSWPLLFRPLHDALLEDCLSQAQASLGLPPQVRSWSPWVKFLRWAISGGKSGPQGIPGIVKF